MRFEVRRRHTQSQQKSQPRVVEVVTPRTNAAALTSAENFFASMALGEPFSVEVAADARRRQFLVRAGSPAMCDQLLSQLSAAYPQAEFRELPARQDPALLGKGEQAVGCTLRLSAPAYLPLRTFTDLDVDGERAAQADPMLGLISALGDLPEGWRGLSQVILQQAPENWCREYQRLAVQHPLEHERVSRPTESAGPMLAFIAILAAVVFTAAQAYSFGRKEQWGQAAAVLTAAAIGACAVILLARRLGRHRVYDMDLVRDKITRIAYHAEVRLVVYAPESVPDASVQAQLRRIAAAYRRFNLAAGNGFAPRGVARARVRAEFPVAWRSRRSMAVLTTLELAGMWHFPHAAADVALLERTTARRWLPMPTAVSEGCTIGTACHQGYEVPVALPTDVLRRHLLMVAKTRRGKSTLMQRLARFSMETEPPRAVLVVDPHRDLAESLLGLVPAHRAKDVVFLDAANLARPFGLNLLDTVLGWDRDRAVTNALAVFQREWGDRYWGPRMEDAFRFALMTLFEANVALCRADPREGRRRQYTLLEVPTVLSDGLFRREVLAAVEDPTVRAWWTDYFEPLDRRFQMEISNPVQTKIHRFEGSTATRQIVGQPASTIDPSGWLRDGTILIVNTGRGIVGESAAALIGSTLLNLATMAIAEQAAVSPDERRSVSIYVDEFHTIPGADYEGILAELNKYGANLVLATQSLARLLALGDEHGRGLRATVFANVDGLFAFNCSAEDADYLVPELGGAIDVQDLVELGEHQCYVRISTSGQRVPTFSVQLDPPLPTDPDVRTRLARESSQRFGRAASLVEADRRSAVERILELRSRHVSAPPPSPPARNEHRRRKKNRNAEVIKP